ITAVTVNVAQTLSALNVSPGSAAVASGGSQPFTAAAIDQFGNTMSVANSVTWSTTGTSNSILTNGLFVAGTTGGAFSVTATSGTVSASAEVTVTATTAVLPDAPTNLVAIGIGAGLVQLTWSETSANIFGFVLEIATDSGFTQNRQRLSVGGTLTRVSLSGLNAGTPYYFRLRA